MQLEALSLTYVVMHIVMSSCSVLLSSENLRYSSSALEVGESYGFLNYQLTPAVYIYIYKYD